MDVDSQPDAADGLRALRKGKGIRLWYRLVAVLISKQARPLLAIPVPILRSFARSGK
jgi:hypothetical protein